MPDTNSPMPPGGGSVPAAPNGAMPDVQTITAQIQRLSEITTAFSAELNVNKLLEMIVDEARKFTNADAGTLYLMDEGHLLFTILQNETFNVRKGGTGEKIELPPVPLVKDNVSAYVALTGETVNIADVYDAKGFDFTGPKKYDMDTGYRSKSMLVVPMKNQQSEIIGVLQLLNAKEKATGEVIGFSDSYTAFTRSLASEAAVSVTNARFMQRLSEIGSALSAELDLNKLLEMIVDEARRFTHADAGTLYIVEENHLQFKILQNETFKTRKGGTGEKIELPPVPLSKSNVSAYVALTGETVNIADVYDAQGFDFTGPKKYDQATGYRSKSMLVVPLRNQEGDIIGVLQLLNSKDPNTGEVLPFAANYTSLTKSLASQAAVAITNARLVADMEHLFESFVSVITTAIDERSPYTAGHIRRVAELAVLMCDAINKADTGKYADVRFSQEKIKEMMMAGWMHDVGKITTPVHVVDKSTKLETITDRLPMVVTRFELIEAIEKAAMLERKIVLIQAGDMAGAEAEEKAFAELKKRLADDLAFITRSNTGGEFMEDAQIACLEIVGNRTYTFNGKEHRYLSDNEIENLSIRKGTLTDAERKVIQDHVVLTIRMLEKIPFTKKLANIPNYAGAHHETLDGKGYPRGLKGDEITLEGRILALMDFFEALTANDRPYKKAMPLEKAFAILRGEADRGKLDKDLLELFIDAKVYEVYHSMHPELTWTTRTDQPEGVVTPPGSAPGDTTALAFDMIKRVLGTKVPDKT